MKTTQQQDAAQAVRPNQTHSTAGPQQSLARSTTEHQHPFAALSSNSAPSNANVQRMTNVDSNSARVGMVSAQRKAISQNGLPDTLKSGIEALSGMSMDHVKVHTNSPEPARINAHAYTQGNNIYMAPGQEKHLAHEAWHVVQQAQGRVRPTLQMKSGVQVNDDAGLEAEADAMGAKAMSVETMGASVQRAASETGGGQENLGLQGIGATGSVIQRFFVESKAHEKPEWIDGDPSDMGYVHAGYDVNDEGGLIETYKKTAPVTHGFQDTIASPAIPSSSSRLSVIIDNNNRKRSRPQDQDNSANEVKSSLRSRPPATSAPAATSSLPRIPIGEDSVSAPTPPPKTIRTLALGWESSLALSTSVIPTADSDRERKTVSTTATIDPIGDNPFVHDDDHPQWSKGHGTKGENDIANDKTVLHSSGARSVEENWENKVLGGLIDGGAGPTRIVFVPRRSNPDEYRAIGTKIHPRTFSALTSHPLGLDSEALDFANGLSVVDEPTSPRPPKAARQDEE